MDTCTRAAADSILRCDPHARMHRCKCTCAFMVNQSGEQISPRFGLLSPCLCSPPLSRAALRSARSPPPVSSSLHHGPKSSAGASQIPPPTAALPLLETHAPPCAPPSPPCAVCCSPGTPRAPCTNTLPKSPGRTSHSAPAQSHAPECRTLKTCIGRAPRIPAPVLPPNLRLQPAYQRAAAPATSPNSDAPTGMPHSAPAAAVDTPRPAALHNYQLRVSPACQQPRSLSRLKLKFQQPGATL